MAAEEPTALTPPNEEHRHRVPQHGAHAHRVLAELAGLLPPLSGEAMAALEADLLQNGCYSPVIVNEGAGHCVDGHNRQSLCEKHGIPLQHGGVRL